LRDWSKPGIGDSLCFQAIGKGTREIAESSSKRKVKVEVKGEKRKREKKGTAYQKQRLTLTCGMY